MALKGHTTIELTNVNTGEKEVYEDNNIVTNAISALFNNRVSRSSALSNLTPIHTKALGGLILFESPLEESPDNITIPPPSVSKIVGYANDTAYSGTDNKRGSRNTSETVKLDNGYKFVWDFATNQGCGTISAVSLVNLSIATAPYIASVITSKVSSINGTSELGVNSTISNALKKMVHYEFNEDEFISIYNTSETAITVKHFRFANKIIRLTDTAGYIYEVSSKKINCPSNITINTSYAWLEGEDEYYYGFYKTSSSTSLNIVRIFKDTYEFDEDYGLKTITLNSNIKCSIGTLDNGFYNTPCEIMNGYLYVMYSNHIENSTPVYLTKFKLNDLSDLQYSSCNSGISMYSPQCMPKLDKVLHAGPINIYEDLSITTRKSNDDPEFFNTGSYRDSGDKVFLDKSGAFISIYHIYPSNYNSHYIYLYKGFLRNYLGTINNLAMPITKTDAQTMKITYTITEE